MVILTLALFASIFDASANVSTGRHMYAEDGWDFQFRSRYLRSESNFSAEGLSATALGNQRFYDAFQNQLYGRWVFSEGWAGHILVAASYVQTQNTSFLETRTGLMPIGLGVDTVFWRNPSFNLIADVTLELPINQIDYDNPTANSPLISDETTTLAARTIIEVPLSKSYLSGSLGFKWRGKGFSALLPYHIGYERPMEPFVLGAELEGAITVIEDDHVASFRHKVNETASGSSLIYNAVDPNHMGLSLWSGYFFGPRTLLRFGLGQTLAGSNAPQYTQIFFNFMYGAAKHRPGTSESFKDYRRRMRKERREQKRRVKKFRTLKEKSYDEAFRESPKDRKKRLESISQELDEIEKDAEGE